MADIATKVKFYPTESQNLSRAAQAPLVGSESSSEEVKKNAKPIRRSKRPKSRRIVDFSSSESDNEVVETPVGSGNTKSKLVDSDAE